MLLLAAWPLTSHTHESWARDKYSGQHYCGRYTLKVMRDEERGPSSLQSRVDIDLAAGEHSETMPLKKGKKEKKRALHS